MPIPASRFIRAFNRSATRACVFFTVGWALPACFLSNEDCTTIGRDGVVVRVVDASTQQPIVVAPTVTLTDGAYTEGLRESGFQPNSRIYSGALEREGNYNLRVEAPGYVTAIRSDLAVRRSGGCSHLQTVEVVIALVATAP